MRWNGYEGMDDQRWVMVKEKGGQSSGQKKMNRSKTRGVGGEREKGWKGRRREALMYCDSREASTGASHDDAIPKQASARPKDGRECYHPSSYDDDVVNVERSGSAEVVLEVHGKDPGLPALDCGRTVGASRPRTVSRESPRRAEQQRLLRSVEQAWC
jgi:hypothetical protein